MEYAICDKRDDPSAKCNFFVKRDGERIAATVELHEALWIVENELSE